MTIRIPVSRLLVACGLIAASVKLHAQHYPAGSEGIRCGSLPPPGLYFSDYNSFYYADRVPFIFGQLDHGFSVFTYAQAPRLMWMTDWKILGAEYGMALRIPFAFKQVTWRINPPPPVFPQPPTTPFNPKTETRFGLADIQIEPLLLSWRLKRFDISAGYSVWAPTGDWKLDRFFLLNPGNGYWSHMFTLGATWFLDEAKTWALSVMNRYEINTEQYRLQYTGPPPFWRGTTIGDMYTLEWSLSKKVGRQADIGLVGHYQKQATPTTPWYAPAIHHYRIAGIGPEAKILFPKFGMTASLRYAYEFGAMEHPEGHNINLTLTKSF